MPKFMFLRPSVIQKSIFFYFFFLLEPLCVSSIDVRFSLCLIWGKMNLVNWIYYVWTGYFLYECFKNLPGSSRDYLLRIKKHHLSMNVYIWSFIWLSLLFSAWRKMFEFIKYIIHKITCPHKIIFRQIY